MNLNTDLDMSYHGNSKTLKALEHLGQPDKLHFFTLSQRMIGWLSGKLKTKCHTGRMDGCPLEFHFVTDTSRLVK